MTRKASHPCRVCGRHLKTHRLAKKPACSKVCRETLVSRAKNFEARRRAEEGQGGALDPKRGHALRTPALALTSRISNSEDDPRQCAAYR